MIKQLNSLQEKMFFEYFSQITSELQSSDRNVVLSKYKTIISNLYAKRDVEWNRGLQIDKIDLIKKYGEEKGMVEFQKQLNDIKKTIEEIDNKIIVINFALNKN